METPWNNSPTWGIICVNDESLVDVKMPQVMRCVLCYSRPICHVVLKQIEEKSCFIFQEQWNNSVTKSCGYKPWIHCKKIKEEMNNNLESPLER
jgi:hypothetical protein